MSSNLQIGRSLAAGKTPSLTRAFVITEMRRTDGGSFVETPVQFVWDANTQSKPRPSWKFGLQLRTNRTDYTGADEPTEQILGPSFTAFTVDGIWDDRYGGKDFAWNTHEAFEQLVARGNIVRINMEDIVIHGLITQYNPDYRRRNYIRYSFTFSPHFRQVGGIARTQKPQVPAALARPEELVDVVDKQLAAAVDQQNGLPTHLLTATSAVADVGNKVTDMIAKVEAAKSILDTQFFGPIETVNNSLKRMASQMRIIRGDAQDVLTSVADVVSDVDLVVGSAVDILDFEDWKRGIAYQMRLIVGSSTDAENQFNTRVDSDIRAVYRPRAGENFYGISNHFYNTPNNWRAIMDANNISYITLDGTETLIIPTIR